MRQRLRCAVCGHRGAVLQHPSWIDAQIGEQPFPVEWAGTAACSRAEESSLIFPPSPCHRARREGSAGPHSGAGGPLRSPNALAEIKAVRFEPKQTLPAKILLAVRDRGQKAE